MKIPSHFSHIVRQALDEDKVRHDMTTRRLFPRWMTINAKIIAKSEGVLCGSPVVEEVFNSLDRRVRVTFLKHDSQFFREGSLIARLSGPAWAVLSGERVALNFLQMLSGIATLTRKYVQVLKRAGLNQKAEIYDTRKTTPGLRVLEKYAVVCGGGRNHRMDLKSMVMIKDNHLKLLRTRLSPQDFEKNRVKKYFPKSIKVSIESGNLREVRWAIDQQADIILLDNMPFSMLRKAVRMIHESSGLSRPLIEVSGGVSLQSISRIARLSVDRISVGALTHSAPAVDLSMKVEH